MKKKVIVIGGGAAGMMSAIYAARNNGDVIILEHTDRLGKKILSTGNGKCNLTNLKQDSSCYRSSEADFPMKVIQHFSAEETIHFFYELGMITKKKLGYVYPNSEQASSVLDVLRLEIARQNIKVVTECQIYSMEQENSFIVNTSKGNYRGDSVILAAGSKAAPKTGSDGSGYTLAQKMGHRVITPLPALVSLRCEKQEKQLAGIRTDAVVTIYIDGKAAAKDRGELQLTDYGISGIPTFQVSRYAVTALHQNKTVEAVLDFLPDMKKEEVKTLIAYHCQLRQDGMAEELLLGVLNKKLVAVLLKRAGISIHDKVSRISSKQIEKLNNEIKAYRTIITAANSFDQAQICCGGVDTREIEARTMESKRVRGLYFAGEMIDVDGICGGYNLQWAWSSGYTAGIHAAQ